MGIDHGRNVVFLGDVVDELVDEDAGLRIESRVWFVAEQILRVQGDGTRNGNTLLHATRKLTRVLIEGSGQVDSFKT